MSVYFPEKKWFNNIYVYLTMLCQVCSGSVISDHFLKTIMEGKEMKKNIEQLKL